MKTNSIWRGSFLRLGVAGLFIQSLLWVATSRLEAHEGGGVAGIPEVVISPQGESNPWTHLVFNNDPAAFQFAIVTDRTGGMREGVFADAVTKLNLLQPEFVMSVGDLIQGYTKDRKQLVEEWEEFDGLVSGLDMPFFYLAGNHDYTNEVMAELWEERYGASYYHFVYRDVLFVGLNSNDGGGIHTISEKQVAWLREVLEANPEPKWTLVFVHAPLWDKTDGSLWPEVEALLDGRKHTVFAGHHHRYVKHQRKGRSYFTLATTGGGSGMRGASFGEFDHVVWVTMSDDGPILANLLLDGIWDEDVRDEALRDRQASLIDGGRLSLLPVLYRESLDKGASELRLTNDSDVPYRIDLAFSQIANVALSSERRRSLEVPPNEVVMVPVEFATMEALAGDFAALEMDWKLRFELQGREVVFDGKEQLVAVEERPIGTASGLRADGDLEDWTGIRFAGDDGQASGQVENWTGEEDAGFEWGMARSGDRLHLAIRAKDDAIVRDDGKAVRFQDGLYVQLDARPLAQRLRNRTNSTRRGNGFLIALAPPAEGQEGGLGVHYENVRPDGVEAVVVSSADGYVAEVSILLAALDEAAKGEWDGFRLNVYQIDCDPGESGFVNRQWQPVWTSAEAIQGAGSFYRE